MCAVVIRAHRRAARGQERVGSYHPHIECHVIRKRLLVKEELANGLQVRTKIQLNGFALPRPTMCSSSPKHAHREINQALCINLRDLSCRVYRSEERRVGKECRSR